MNRIARWSSILALGTIALAPSLTRAQTPLAQSLGFQPLVPVSAFARPASWFDPSRLHISSSVTVGSGWGTGSGTNALQVTSFSYQFSKPAWLEVSLGNAWGGGTASGSNMFLEGLRLGFRPTANSFFSIQYQNVRSPLQLNRYGPWGW